MTKRALTTGITGQDGSQEAHGTRCRASVFNAQRIGHNRESPRRGETFAQGPETCPGMGNIDALRDWGHAKDYVRMRWEMLQQDTPENDRIATGKPHPVRAFITSALENPGISLAFEGECVRTAQRQAFLKPNRSDLSRAMEG